MKTEAEIYYKETFERSFSVSNWALIQIIHASPTDHVYFQGTLPALSTLNNK